MEREQIIKALECCSKGTCMACPLKEDYSPCSSTLTYSALSLIKELTEENERLHADCTELTQCCTKLETLYKIECKRVDTIKADTVRKMQERMKEAFKHHTYNCRDCIISKVDKIAKEMLEGIE